MTGRTCDSVPKNLTGLGAKPYCLVQIPSLHYHSPSLYRDRFRYWGRYDLFFGWYSLFNPELELSWLILEHRYCKWCLYCAKGKKITRIAGILFVFAEDHCQSLQLVPMRENPYMRYILMNNKPGPNLKLTFGTNRSVYHMKQQIIQCMRKPPSGLWYVYWFRSPHRRIDLFYHRDVIAVLLFYYLPNLSYCIRCRRRSNRGRDWGVRGYSSERIALVHLAKLGRTRARYAFHLEAVLGRLVRGVAMKVEEQVEEVRWKKFNLFAAFLGADQLRTNCSKDLICVGSFHERWRWRRWRR